MKKLSVSEKRLVIATLIVAVAAFGWSLAEPLLRGWIQPYRKIESKKGLLMKERLAIASFRQTKSAYDKWSQSARPARDDQEMTAMLLSDIEEISRAASFEIAGIKPQTVRDVDGHKEIGVEISAESGIQSLVKFLDGIEGTPKLFRVKRLMIQGGGGGTLRCTLLVATISIR